MKMTPILKTGRLKNFLLMGSAAFLMNGIGLSETPTTQTQPQMQQTQPQQPKLNVSPEDLEKFVEAQKSLEVVREKHKDVLTGTQDQQKAQQYQRDALKAVEEAGLDRQKYQQIAQAIAQNPELRKKLSYQ